MVILNGFLAVRTGRKFLKLASLLMGENPTEIGQCGVTEGHGLSTWEAGALLCAVQLLQASVFLLIMVCGKIYLSVSSTKANCE